MIPGNATNPRALRAAHSDSKYVTSYRPNFRLGPIIALIKPRRSVYEIQRVAEKRPLQKNFNNSKRRNSFVCNFQSLLGRKFAR